MTDKQPRWLEYVPLDDLVPDPRNPKDHTIEDLRASLGRFGYTEPISVDERTGMISSGHGRREMLLADRDEGVAAAEGIVVDGQGRWTVPVVRGWRSENEDEALAYLIAANQLTTKGGWNDADLVAALERMSETPLKLDGIGFDQDELDRLLISVRAHEHHLPEDVDPDDVPPVPVVPVTKQGDLWLLGPHRVLCGDATNIEHVAVLQGGVIPQAMLTDPPYCSGGFQEAGRSSGSIGTDARIKPRIANDTLSTRGYQALLRSVIGLSGAPILYVFTDWRMWNALFDVMESSGCGVRNMIVWDKGSPGMGRGWRTQHELVMYATSAMVEFDNHKAQGNVIGCQRTGNPLHPTQKPVELLEAILAVTDMAATIYDPFAGSGSTLIAAHQQNRQAFLMEMDPIHVDTICARWQRLTGDKPVLKATGEPHDFLSGA